MSDSKSSEVFGGSLTISGGGEDMSAGGETVRGTIVNVLEAHWELWIEGVGVVSDTSV